MTMKKRVLRVVTIAFLSLLFVATFFSKTIYYYTHQKVTAVAIVNGFINNEFNTINTNLVIDGGDNNVLPVQLKEPLVVKKIMVKDLEYVNENEAILLFDIASVQIARKYILADIENCRSKVPMNKVELTALEEQLNAFDSHIDKNGNLLSGKSGFITNISFAEGDKFSGVGKMYTISNENTNYMVNLNLSIDQGSYIDDNCEITLQKEDTRIKGIVNKIIFNEKECSVVVEPSAALTEADAVELFKDISVLSMDVKTSSGRYETIVPAESIIDNQYIYIINTVENFLGSRTIAEKINIEILATNGTLVAIDTKNQKIMPESQVIIGEQKLLDGEEVVVLLK